MLRCAGLVRRDAAHRWRPAPGERSYHYDPRYLDAAARAEILTWLATLHPLWELRYSTRRPPPPGKDQRGLLRPVYWLGNWQVACVRYYEPPRRNAGCPARPRPFPPPLARAVRPVA